MEPLPMDPEQWRDVVQNAVTATGHGDEVIVGLESTPSGWRVMILPPVTPAPPDGPATL